jgi:diacylglycerol kinase (ATP)
VAEPVDSTFGLGYEGRTLVVLNPAAGQANVDRVRRQIGGAFAVRGARFDLVETTGSGDAEALAREAVRLGYRAVAVAGGDGTVAEVVTGLVGSRVALGIIPMGTANLVAANLGWMSANSTRAGTSR